MAQTGRPPLRHLLARNEECEADREAVRLCGDPDAFISALRKIYGWWYAERGVIVDNLPAADDYPPLEERIKLIQHATGLAR